MREKILTSIADIAFRRTLLIIWIIIILTLIMGALASRLRITTKWSDIMPSENPMAKEFNRILEQYNTASVIIVVIKGDETRIKRFADEIAPEFERLEEFINRVDYKIDRDFLLNHGFMLQREDDLRNIKGIFKRLDLLPFLTQLNDSFEKEYIEDKESISTREKENNAVRFLDGIQNWLKTMMLYASNGSNLKPEKAEKAVDRLLLGDNYFISQDKQMLLMFLQPNFSIYDIETTVKGINRLDELINDKLQKYPGLMTGTTGTPTLARDEMEAVQSDMYITTIIAFIVIMALFIISFRMWIAPILAGITLIIGIIWAAAFAYLLYGKLNLMTSMFAVILVGLGIDFSIHIISLYTERRSHGDSVALSLKTALNKSGTGIITGALTTAAAFFTLTISDSQGLSQFGVIAGIGVISCMLSTIIVLPAMISLREKLLKTSKGRGRGFSGREFIFLGNFSQYISRRFILFLTGLIILTAFLLYRALNIKFDYNYLNMEPVGLKSIILQDEMIEKFDISADFTLITAETVEEARSFTEKVKKLKLVGMVESISNYIPSAEQQKRRIPHIIEIRDNLIKNRGDESLNAKNPEKLLSELQRLEFNIIEFSDLAYLGGQEKVDRKCREIVGDPDNPGSENIIENLMRYLRNNKDTAVKNLNLFQSHYKPYLRKTALKMTSVEPITLENIPRNIYQRFASKMDDNFLVTIYPREQVWNFEFLNRFTEDIRKIDPRATGIPPLFLEMVNIIRRDGKRATVLTIIVVFTLLLLDFRNMRTAVLAMVPLIFGSIWMVGTMNLAGLMLTFVNIMGIPLILGIGIDDGVHILHRYRMEGKGKIGTVMSSTGKAVFLTSLTTMMGFGSLKFATYRGLGSLGTALFIGVGVCFLASVLILPALIGLFERNKKG
ncbi:MAG: MMPL family transporter [Fidelibacterota bacterium]